MMKIWKALILIYSLEVIMTLNLPIKRSQSMSLLAARGCDGRANILLHLPILFISIVDTLLLRMYFWLGLYT